MKKTIILLLILLLCSCTNKNIIEVNYDKLYNKINSYDSYIIYFCNKKSTCQTFNKTIKKIAKENNIKLYYLNTEKLKDKEKLVIESLYFSGMNITEPSIVKINNGIVSNRQINITDYKITKEFLK